MPTYIAPQKLGAHRVAGIALFRALLRCCNRAQLDDSTRTACQNVVRNSFKRNCKNQSKLELRKAFSAGYEALNLFNASASGDASSTTRITSLIATTPPALIKRPKRAPLLPPPKSSKPKYPALNPDSSAVLSRPRPFVSGTRQIPKLRNANNFPILLFKKPQPHQLGAYIRRKIKRRDRRTVAVQRMCKDLDTAEWEDDWDDEIEGLLGETGGSGPECEEEEERVEWAHAVWDGILGTEAKLKEEQEKSFELVRKFEEVIEREKELARQEEVQDMKKSKNDTREENESIHK